MELVLLLTALGFMAVGAVLVLLLRRLIPGHMTHPVSVDWINDLSAARYRPMQRLLNGEDYAFLAAQPGCNRCLLRRMRSERRKLFRGYLACLSRDFGRICAALKMLMAYSSQDRADLAGILYKQQALFALGMLGVQWQLALHACGVGTVDIRSLVRVMEYMRLELRQFIPREVTALA